jgi:hypothetical protein
MRTVFMTDNPPPNPTLGKPIWDLVIEDMKARDSLGRSRYGTPLQAFNGRDALQDAYEEVLDLAVYLRQAIEERDNPELSKDPEEAILSTVHTGSEHWVGWNGNDGTLAGSVNGRKIWICPAECPACAKGVK